jgi:hypothetical protein
MLQQEYNRIKNIKEYKEKNTKLYIYDFKEKKEWIISNKKYNNLVNNDYDENENENKNSIELDSIILDNALQEFSNKLASCMISIKKEHDWNKNDPSVFSFWFNPYTDPIFLYDIGYTTWKFISINTKNIREADSININILADPYLINHINIGNFLMDVTVEFDFNDEIFSYDNIKFKVICTKHKISLINIYGGKLNIIDKRTDEDIKSNELFDISFLEDKTLI